MSKWVSCSRPNGHAMWVNVENAVTLEPLPNGNTKIVFNGSAQELIVSQKPEQIISGAGDATRT